MIVAYVEGIMVIVLAAQMAMQLISVLSAQSMMGAVLLYYIREMLIEMEL